MSSIIEKLYYDNIQDAIIYGQDSHSTQADHLVDRCLEKLTAVLNDSEKELFGKYCDAQAEAEEITRYHTFTYAMKFGILLMAEAFTGKGDITGEKHNRERSLLRRLFDGTVAPAEHIVPRDPEFRKMSKEIDDKENCLMEKLPPDGQQPFRDLVNLYLKSSYLYGSTCFTHGFSLGAALTAEAFAEADRLKCED